MPPTMGPGAARKAPPGFEGGFGCPWVAVGLSGHLSLHSDSPHSLPDSSHPQHLHPGHIIWATRPDPVIKQPPTLLALGGEAAKEDSC